MVTANDDLATRELAVIAARLATAARPEDIFGALTGQPPEQVTKLRQQYRRLALAVHPDRHANDPRAHAAFITLQRLYAAASERIALGRYGEPAAPANAVVITTRRRAYTVGAKLAEGDLADLYTCQIAENGPHCAGLLKIARDPADNDLLQNEALSLRQLRADLGGAPVPAYIPKMLESFVYPDADGAQRQVNAFPLAETERGPLPADAWFSLREVRDQYRDGVDPRQMAWIWRRLLIALGHAHDRAVIHGAVLPTHILIHPESHALLLIDWCQSVHQAISGSGSHGPLHIPAISPAYERWYPPAVLAKASPTPAVDLEMALRCMVDLLGGDRLTSTVPVGVPGPLRAYLQGALATVGQASAWQLYQRFSDLMQALWGRRRFVPFSMPARQRGGTA